MQPGSDGDRRPRPRLTGPRVRLQSADHADQVRGLARTWLRELRPLHHVRTGEHRGPHAPPDPEPVGTVLRRIDPAEQVPRGRGRKVGRYQVEDADLLLQRECDGVPSDLFARSDVVRDNHEVSATVGMLLGGPQHGEAGEARPQPKTTQRESDDDHGGEDDPDHSSFSR